MTRVAVDGQRWLDRGTGAPTLVFLHYFSGAAASWQWVMRSLESDFRCVAIDLPGFGQAPPVTDANPQKLQRLRVGDAVGPGGR